MYAISIPCVVDTDPFFDKRSLRSDYHKPYTIPVDVETLSFNDADLSVGYRVWIKYADADLPSFTVLRVELLMAWPQDDRKFGVPRKSRPAAGIEIGLTPMLAWDAEHGSGREQVLTDIDKHQDERDEDANIDF